MKYQVLLVALAVTACGETVADRMTADRPGFRNSTHLVGQGVLQLESGFRLNHQKEVGQGNLFVIEPEIRFGLTNWLELRLYSESLVVRRPHEEGAPTGLSDLEPGLKFPLYEHGDDTRVAAIVQCSVPTGNRSQTSGGYQPATFVVWERELGKEFALSGTLNMTRLKDDEGFLWQPGGSVSVSKDLTRRLRGFAEIYELSPSSRGAGNQWVIDSGVQRLVGDHVMLDASMGHAVHGKPGEWFVMVGFSIRSHDPKQ